LRCGRKGTKPAGLRIRERCSANIVSRLILWRPCVQAGLAGLSEGGRRAMRAPPFPCQCSFGAALNPFSHGHGTPDQVGQA
jgi:hypothetical protein